MVIRIDGRCFQCNQPFEWGPEDNKPGRIYSVAGRKETFISGFCETCFDRITKFDYDEEENEDDPFYFENNDHLWQEVAPRPPEIIWAGHCDPTLYADV